MSTYRTSPIKRQRRTKADMTDLRAALLDILSDEHPMTVRQVFYQAVSRGVVEKTEAAYKSIVCRLLVDMRKSGELPFEWLADNTRWQRRPNTWDSWQAALQDVAQLYRRSLWTNQGVYIEVWLEKDALAGVLTPETYEWDVPLMVTRGYPSQSFLHTAGMYIAQLERPAYLYYLGDADPSGRDIPRVVERELRQFAPDTEIHFTELAVTDEQIRIWDLPTRPTKKTDSRARNFEGESVEVDALPPAELRRLVHDAIVSHVDVDALAMTEQAERSERQLLSRIAAGNWA